MLQAGMTFPDFSLEDQDGTQKTLRDFMGKWLVVYFYPRDNTSGCTMEAQNFAALFNKFAGHKANIVGISPDSVKSHCHFAVKHSLPFTLLADTQHKLLEAAGVWQLKKMAGREYMGVVRTTMLLDPDGMVRKVWNKVKVRGHAEEVFAELAALSKQ